MRPALVLDVAKGTLKTKRETGSGTKGLGTLCATGEGETISGRGLMRHRTDFAPSYNGHPFIGMANLVAMPEVLVLVASCVPWALVIVVRGGHDSKMPQNARGGTRRGR